MRGALLPGGSWLTPVLVPARDWRGDGDVVFVVRHPAVSWRS